MAQYLKGNTRESKSVNVLLKLISIPGIVHWSLALFISVLMLSELVMATPKQFSTSSEGERGQGSSLAQQPDTTELQATRAAAERAYQEGLQLGQQGTAESLQQAIKKYEEVLPLFRSVGEKAREAAALTDIGSIYSFLGEKEKALEFFNQAFPLSRTTGNKKQEAVTLSNIGRVYRDLGEKEKALEFFNQALPLSRTTGDKKQEAITLNNIGVLYESLGEKEKALEFYNQSLSLSRASGDKVGEARTLTNIGKVYNALGEEEKALEFYKQSLSMRRRAGDKQGQVVTLYNLAKLEHNRGNLNEAITQMEVAINIIDDLVTNISSKELRDSYSATVQDYYQFYTELLRSE